MNTIKFISILIFSHAMISCEKKDIATDPGKYTSGIPSDGTTEIIVIHDEVEGVPMVIVGSVGSHFIVSFKNDIEGNPRDFEPLQNSLPLIMKDSEGNKWDITGKAVDGPRKGDFLHPSSSFMGYWFSWGTFFEGAKIYGESTATEPKDRKYLSGEWLIPSNEVFNGGPGKDGIPALLNPELGSLSNINYLENDDLVLGFVLNNEARAYPHKILNWHEIINDKIQGKDIIVTYCPLTGTGIGWNQFLHEKSSTFGVSGLLYNSNLIPYDRETDSYWSQIRLECVKGSRKGEKIENIQLVETTWNTWVKMFPDTKVVSSNTGYSRNYTRYPYGDYKSSNDLIFPVSIDDERLHPKEVVHGIILNNKAKIYRYEHFK
ncbi:MAG: DUF3179 domain-containing (seleno)protein [Bacteroidales bacterium]|nr:DUF3179 domain-containing (seleno)protein [Bacteroidales bacterium]